MLFNSYIFIFVFLPVTFGIYFLLAKYRNVNTAIASLVLTSLFFYGWWNPIYLLLIITSVCINYFLGNKIAYFNTAQNYAGAKIFFIVGILFNLGLLGFFKYTNFMIENINIAFNLDIEIKHIVLPLAISFYTFQQIAYLVDTYRGIITEFKFIHYALFVTFFPQLIAGPIVHHKEMLPQFMVLENLSPKLENVIAGLSMFTLGLFKKVVLADGIAQYSTPVFDAAAAGEPVTFFIAWSGALGYTLQLYFDFSGYSDMAIGIARMFGIRLPLNFNSPYKSLNIIEFWRRWHITLSRFLRDYVYFSLGGNRKGSVRRYVNLLTTMILGGLWHGAGWTFILWGCLHGLYLIINHAWHHIKLFAKLEFLDKQPAWKIFCWLLTFISVVNAWVLFRATTFESAVEILKGMYGFNGIAIPNAIYARLGSISDILNNLGITPYLGGGAQFMYSYLWILLLLAIATLMPNTQQIMKNYFIYKDKQENAIFSEGLFSSRILKFNFTTIWAFFMATVLVIAVFGLTSVSEFLYFQF